MNETTISALQYSKYSMSSQIQIQYVSAKSLKGISFPKKKCVDRWSNDLKKLIAIEPGIFSPGARIAKETKMIGYIKMLKCCFYVFWITNKDIDASIDSRLSYHAVTTDPNV